MSIAGFFSPHRQRLTGLPSILLPPSRRQPPHMQYRTLDLVKLPPLSYILLFSICKLRNLLREILSQGISGI